MGTLRDRYRQFNTALAVRATAWFGTMGAFYLLFLYGLLPLVLPRDTVTFLYWSNVIQLVALPLLAVGQQIQGAGAVQQAKETHDAVLEELVDLKEVLRDVQQILATRSGA